MNYIYCPITILVVEYIPFCRRCEACTSREPEEIGTGVSGFVSDPLACFIPGIYQVSVS